MLQKPYVFGALVVLVTAISVYGLQYTVEPERAEANKKLLYKILIAGGISVFALGYFIYRPDPVLTEPFPTDG
jgi:hypothetical protein